MFCDSRDKTRRWRCVSSEKKKPDTERVNDHQLHIPQTLVLKIKSIIAQAQVVVSQNSTVYVHWQPLGIMLEKKKKNAELMLENEKKKKKKASSIDIETVMTM